MKARKHDRLTLMAVFVVALLMIAANTVYAGMNPPLEGLDVKTTGPAIIGEITIRDAESEGIYVSFFGECKTGSIVELVEGEPVLPQFEDASYITFGMLVANIDIFEGWIIENIPSNIYGCNPDASSVIINTINQFYVTAAGDIKAKAILLPLVSKEWKNK